nr:uncharacterized protein LOC115266927 isoform X2 [Aedes albopictus]
MHLSTGHLSFPSLQTHNPRIHRSDRSHASFLVRYLQPTSHVSITRSEATLASLSASSPLSVWRNTSVNWTSKPTVVANSQPTYSSLGRKPRQLPCQITATHKPRTHHSVGSHTSPSISLISPVSLEKYI